MLRQLEFPGLVGKGAVAPAGQARPVCWGETGSGANHGQGPGLQMKLLLPLVWVTPLETKR